ncbi:MAG: hypothetical protein HYX69_18160 [Planctomycetia bacterium]|nr:hypothetical protein [Planctomycetia bacterium]
METIKRVRDIDPSDLPAIERAIGQHLDPSRDQALVVRLVTLPAAVPAVPTEATLPEWCNVLEGLSDDELLDFEATLSQRPVLSHRISRA